MLIIFVLRGMCISVGYILYDENLNIFKYNFCFRMFVDFIVICVYFNKKMVDWKLLENIIGD